MDQIWTQITAMLQELETKAHLNPEKFHANLQAVLSDVTTEGAPGFPDSTCLLGIKGTRIYVPGVTVNSNVAAGSVASRDTNY